MGKGCRRGGEVNSPQQSCCQSLSPNENCIVCWRSLFWILMLLLEFDVVVVVVVIFIHRLLLLLLVIFFVMLLLYLLLFLLLLFCAFAAFAFSGNFAGGSSVCSQSLQRCFDYEAASTFPPPLLLCLPLLPLHPLAPWGVCLLCVHLYLVCIGGVAFALLATSIKCNIELKRQTMVPLTFATSLSLSLPSSLSLDFCLFISLPFLILLLCVTHSQLHSSLPLSTLDKACRFTRMWRTHTSTHTHNTHTHRRHTHRVHHTETDSG